MADISKLSSDEACNALPPVVINYTPKGEWLESGLIGLKTYASTPGKSKRAIIYVYDIGGFCAQNYQGADLLASQGYHVFVPDFHIGQSLSFAEMAKMDPEKSKAVREKFSGGFPGKIDTQREPVLKMIAELKSKGYEQIVGVGFCWGGNLLVTIPELDAIAMVHPGAAVNPNSAAKLEIPTCLLPSMNEDEEKMEGFHQVMKAKSFGDKCILKWYKNSRHGFAAARADLNDDYGRQQYADAHGVVAKFFDDVL